METAILATSIVVLLLGVFIVLFVIFQKHKQRKNREEKTMMQLSFQQELLRTQLEIQEQTFKTIAEEIHDNIGQILSMAKLNLDTVDLEAKEKATEKIADAGQLVFKAIKDLRHLSKSLNMEAISTIGFLKATETELQQLQKNGIQTHLEMKGRSHRLDAQKELILFRIVQESLQNIVKHADASQICVMAVFNQQNFERTISDNGCGFDYTQIDLSGSGLQNMKNRAVLIGAHFTIESRPQGGTVINIQLPI
jgi:two-component system, NarL family, sensor kinase